MRSFLRVLPLRTITSALRERRITLESSRARFGSDVRSSLSCAWLLDTGCIDLSPRPSLNDCEIAAAVAIMKISELRACSWARSVLAMQSSLPQKAKRTLIHGCRALPLIWKRIMALRYPRRSGLSPRMGRQAGHCDPVRAIRDFLNAIPRSKARRRHRLRSHRRRLMKRCEKVGGVLDDDASPQRHDFKIAPERLTPISSGSYSRFVAALAAVRPQARETRSMHAAPRIAAIVAETSRVFTRRVAIGRGSLAALKTNRSQAAAGPDRRAPGEHGLRDAAAEHDDDQRSKMFDHAGESTPIRGFRHLVPRSPPAPKASPRAQDQSFGGRHLFKRIVTSFGPVAIEIKSGGGPAPGRTGWSRRSPFCRNSTE